MTNGHFYMGIKERKNREKELRRNFIVDAAQDEFFKNGFEKTTMEDVAQRAELSKGTLYLYFKTKEELYLAITMRALKLLKNTFQEAFDSEITGIEKLKALGRSYFNYHVKYPDYHIAIHFHHTKMQNMIENSMEAMCFKEGAKSIEVIARAFMVGMADGTINRKCNPILSSIILWAQGFGVVQLLDYMGKQLLEVYNISHEDLIEGSIQNSINSIKA